jgi:hypothetical protein
MTMCFSRSRRPRTSTGWAVFRKQMLSAVGKLESRIPTETETIVAELLEGWQQLRAR